jgi:hypothetical protein
MDDDDDDDDDDPFCDSGLIDESRTLRDARQWLRARMEDGAHCPCCTQLAKVYTRKLNSAMARDLIWLVRMSAVSTDGWVDIAIAPKCFHASRELAKLVYWELIEMLNGQPVGGARTTGIWRPTDSGVRFARGRIAVPSHVRIYDGRRLSFDNTRIITIRQALGEHFDFNELWTTRV